MRRLGWSCVLLLMAMLVACADPTTDGVREFRADLRPDAGTSQARGVSAAALYGEYLVVIGTFSNLGSAATRAAILEGEQEVFRLLVVDDARNGRFSDFFEVTSQQARDLRDDRYHIRIYSTQHSTVELRGNIEFTRVRPSGEDAYSLWESLQE